MERNIIKGIRRKRLINRAGKGDREDDSLQYYAV
jgi:hypothetical protein